MKNHKIVAVTPAGRKEYMEVLLPQIIRQNNFVDEYHLWVNTKNPIDLEYLDQLEKKYNGFVILHKDFINHPYAGNNFNISNYWSKAKEKGVVYFRLDDDIVFIEDDYFEKMYEFKIRNPQYIMTTSNVVNNAVFDYYRQSEGKVYQSLEKMTNHCMCPVGWKDGHFAEKRHIEVLSYLKDKNKEILYTESREIPRGHRFSINALCWLGDDLLNITIGRDEEQFITELMPREINKSIGLLGSCISCHFAFHTQRPYLGTTDILEKYKLICENE